MANGPTQAPPTLAPTEVLARVAREEDREEYNFEHFRTRHLLRDARRTLRGEGVPPGELAPDFSLPRADGAGQLRLSDLRGEPVLVHFGSVT
ncbi:MAG TPA: hypothetical protein VFQ22_13200 [Longimicrobiales bacterium]|nr:hypothetical protein [Longimicrobiales bacterium]